MLKDIFFSPGFANTTGVAHTFQAEGLQRKSEATCCLKALLPLSWMRPETVMHLVLTNLCCSKPNRPNSAFSHIPCDPTGYNKQAWCVNESKF